MKKQFLMWAAIVLPASLAAAQGSQWLSTPQPIGSVFDVTRETGVAFSGDVTHWEIRRADDTSEHLAGRTPSGTLHMFSWGTVVHRHDDVTARTGVAIKGSPVAWVAQEREQIAAISSADAVTLFTRTSALVWTKSDLSAGTGKKFKGPLVGWVTPTDPPREHVAALSTEDELLVFSRSGDDPFLNVDVTEKTGLKFNGLGGAWNIKGDLFTVVHLVAVGLADNKLYDLTSANLRNWTATEIPMPAGHTATTDVSAWLSSFTSTENVAVRTQSNALVVLSRSSAGGNWEESDLTAIDGEEVTGRPVSYQEGTLAVRGKDGRALIFWRTTRSPLWHLLDLTELHGVAWDGTPAGRGADLIAGVDPNDHHLRIVWDFTRARFLTEEVGERFETLRAQSGTRQTVTIVWNPETTTANCNPTGCKSCELADIGKGLKLEPAKADAAMRDVSAYFRENSGGLLAVANTTLGPFTSLKHRAHYAEDHGPGKCEDGWSDPGGGDIEKLAEAVRQAEAGFDFKSKDANGDGTLSPDELAVVVMIPREAGDRGSVRPVVAESNADLVVDGVMIPTIVEINVGTSGLPHLGTIARELSRQIFNHVDMSWGMPFPRPATALGALTPMDGVGAQGHHDGFSKLKFGWVRPRLIWHPGDFRVKDVETGHSVRVLLNPARGVGELFLIENRFRGGSTFDKGLPADGLAIYHVLQDPTARQSARPPFYVSAPDWSRIGADDWGHKAVRLLPPVANRGYVSGGSSVPYNDSQSLWRQDAGYDLGPFPSASARGQSWLRWADGPATTNPGVAIRNISAAGSEMQFTVATVPALNTAFCATLGKNCGRVNDGLGGQVECGTCTAPATCRSDNVCRCTENQCDGRCGSIDRRCEPGSINCFGNCPEGSFCVVVSPGTRPFCKRELNCECGAVGGRCRPCPRDPLAPPPLR